MPIPSTEDTGDIIRVAYMKYFGHMIRIDTSESIAFRCTLETCYHARLSSLFSCQSQARRVRSLRLPA